MKTLPNAAHNQQVNGIFSAFPIFIHSALPFRSALLARPFDMLAAMHVQGYIGLYCNSLRNIHSVLFKTLGNCRCITSNEILDGEQNVWPKRAVPNERAGLDPGEQFICSAHIFWSTYHSVGSLSQSLCCSLHNFSVANSIVFRNSLFSRHRSHFGMFIFICRIFHHNISTVNVNVEQTFSWLSPLTLYECITIIWFFFFV